MPVPQERKFTLCGTAILPVLENDARCEFDPRFIVAQFKIIKKTGFKSATPRLMTKNFQGGTRHAIYPWNQSKIENPQERAFISRKSI
ncbi:hypothetical protein QUB05_08560 [Microcoleus sp. F10-C6]|uniref:hypothetical protein n=1 Tax=unclassified Microcoleus TaxID=2642155 RepID=UPI002FD262FE